MPHQPHNPERLAKPVGQYAHALEVQVQSRLLFISGQIPGAEGTNAIPAAFDDQAALIWTNIGHILRTAHMDVTDIVKVTTYLTHPDQAQQNSVIRQQFLGNHTPALTVVVVQLLDSRWLLEVEVIAAQAAASP
ncbi:RidA family protein [bacterium]|nr:RidA family protein [bacterium]